MGVILAASEEVIRGGLTWWDWAAAAIIIVVAYTVGRLLRMVLTRAAHRRDSEHAAAEVVGRIGGSIVLLGGLVYALGVVGVRLGPLVGALGIGGLAVAFAAQSILSNFLASVILQMRRPFRRGDQVSTNDIDGVVEDVNFRTVVLRTFEGERVFVPCADVLGKPITNHTAHGRRRTTLAVGVSYDADLEEARTVIKKAIENATGVLERPAPEVWVESFGDSTVNLAVRFWHAPDIASKWRVRNEVAIATKQSLDDAGIDMPFPVVTLLQQHQRTGGTNGSS
jgi:small conductance mechanosensitive channel